MKLLTPFFVTLLGAGSGLVESAALMAVTPVEEASIGELAGKGSEARQELRIGLIDASLLLQQAPQMKMLQATQAVEVQQVKKEIDQINREWLELDQQIKEAGDLRAAKPSVYQKPYEQLFQKQEQFRQRQAQLAQQNEASQVRHQKAQHDLLSDWICEVVACPEYQVDLVLFDGTTPLAHSGGVLFKKLSDRVIDLTQAVVNVAIAQDEGSSGKGQEGLELDIYADDE